MSNSRWCCHFPWDGTQGSGTSEIYDWRVAVDTRIGLINFNYKVVSESLQTVCNCDRCDVRGSDMQDTADFSSQEFGPRGDDRLTKPLSQISN